jgi:mannitol-1-phosphate/altronate dehydrogenase
MGDVLKGQDGLFTVIERSPDGERARVIGSLLDYHFAPDDPEAVLRALADPRTRLVTLTITGGGYLVGEDGTLTASDDDLQHDLDNPDRPRTTAGFLVEALRRRRDAGAGPFTVLSCDNLPDSGAAARAMVVGFAELRDPELAGWICEHASFPASMVDRITPETSPELRDEVELAFGVPDRWPVVTEPFRQWVVEDDFCAGRPPLEQVGVEFVSDVAAYKLVKARLLNGGHCALGYLGALRGHHTTDQAMADPVVRECVERMLADEVVPLLPDVPGLDLQAYLQTTLQRFANPAISDSLDRLCRRGSVKMPSYLLPSLREARAQGRQAPLLVLAVAGWLKYLRGADLAGQPLEVQDPKAQNLVALAQAGGDDPRRVLGARSVFGDLVEDGALVQELGWALRTLSRDGLGAALRDAALRDVAAVLRDADAVLRDAVLQQADAMVGESAA